VKVIGICFFLIEENGKQRSSKHRVLWFDSIFFWCVVGALKFLMGRESLGWFRFSELEAVETMLFCFLGEGFLAFRCLCCYLSAF